MGRIVVSVARLVMSVRKDSQSAFGMRRRKLGLGSRTMKRMLASVDLETVGVFLAADAFSARMAAAAISIDYSMIRHLLDTDIG